MFALYIEEELLNPREQTKIIKSLSNPSVLQKCGGFLLRMSYTEERTCIGILPSLMEGQRTHHYDIKLPDKDALLFSGSIDATGSLSMIPLVEQGFDNTDLNQSAPWLIGLYRGLMAFISAGLKKKTILDWTTKQIFNDLGWKDHNLERLEDLNRQSPP